MLPYLHFVPWAIAHGLNVQLFFEELFSTPIGSFFGMDVIVSACVLTLFIIEEGRRLQMNKLWFPIAGTFLVGVSFGLPLYLYMRHPYRLLPNPSINTDAAR